MGELSEKERFSAQLSSLWGTNETRDNVVVVLTPQGGLKAFELDPRKKSSNEVPLPAWSKNTYVTMHRGDNNFNRNDGSRKRGRNDNQRSNNNGRGRYNK